MVRQLMLLAALVPLGVAGAPPALPPPAVVLAPPAQPQQPAPTLASIPLPDLEARLGALSPKAPEAYFLLGEELAAEAEIAPAARPLAQSLLVLSLELERSRAGAAVDSARGRSVCLALAAIATSDAERRWLLALARSLDAGRGDPDFEAPGPGPSRREAALDLANALGYVRAGEGRRAKTLLDNPAVAELLNQYQALLAAPGMTVDASTVRRYMDQWPVCPECRNRRAVTRTGEGGGTTVLCYTCRGNPGPRLSDGEVLLQLRLESALLSGIQRSWAAQIAVDSGAPLRDLDPSELGATYGVDASRPYWRDGQWQGEPQAAPPPPPEPPVPAQSPPQT